MILIKKHVTSIMFAFVALFLSSCLSVSTIQTGKTLGKNNFELAVSGSYGKYSQISVLDKDGDYDYKPVFAVRGQYGVSKKLDIGFTFDQSSFIGPTVKWQFAGDIDSRFASSIGLNVGLNFGLFLFGNFAHYTTVPLYLSYHPKKNISVYLTPRYIMGSENIFTNQSSKPGLGSSFTIFGNSYGVIIGTKHKLALELSSFRTEQFKPTQFSIGYLYVIGR